MIPEKPQILHLGSWRFRANQGTLTRQSLPPVQRPLLQLGKSPTRRTRVATARAPDETIF